MFPENMCFDADEGKKEKGFYVNDTIKMEFLNALLEADFEKLSSKFIETFLETKFKLENVFELMDLICDDIVGPEDKEEFDKLKVVLVNRMTALHDSFEAGCEFEEEGNVVDDEEVEDEEVKEDALVNIPWDGKDAAQTGRELAELVRREEAFWEFIFDHRGGVQDPQNVKVLDILTEGM